MKPSYLVPPTRYGTPASVTSPQVHSPPFLWGFCWFLRPQPADRNHPVRNCSHGSENVVVGDIDLGPGEFGMLDHGTEQLLFVHESLQISVLRRISRNLQALLARFRHRFGASRAQNDMKAEREQAVFEPGKIIVPPPVDHLVDLSGKMEPIDDPRIVAFEFEELHPGFIRLSCAGFFLRLEVDESATPGEIGEGTPFRGNDGGVVAVLSLSDDLRVFIEGEGDFRLEGKTGSLEDDLWTELDTHEVTRLSGSGFSAKGRRLDSSSGCAFSARFQVARSMGLLSVVLVDGCRGGLAVAHRQDYGCAAARPISSRENPRPARPLTLVGNNRSLLCSIKSGSCRLDDGVRRLADRFDHRFDLQPKFGSFHRYGSPPPRIIRFSELHFLAFNGSHPVVMISEDTRRGGEEHELDPLLFGMMDLFLSRRHLLTGSTINQIGMLCTEAF